MTRDRAILVGYAAAVVVVTLVHRADVLAAALVATLALAGRDAGRVALRAIRAIVFFNVVVSASYVAASLVEGGISWDVLVRLNLRVVLLTCLTVLFGLRVNAFRALAFSRSLVYLLTVAYSQVATFRRLIDEFRLAFTSRTLRRARTVDRYRHAAATASFVLRKSVNETTEITLAMTSRGFFDV